MESNKSDPLAYFQCYRWERIPNELVSGKLIKEISIGFCQLRFYKGKITINNEIKNCLIREFISSTDEVLEKAENELLIIGTLRDRIKIADVYGLIIEERPCNLLKYILVTQYFKNSFKNVKRDQIGSAHLLCHLAKSLKIMQEKEIFHGALSPEFIYLDENDEIVLGNFFWSSDYAKTRPYEDYIQLLKFLDESFMSPETLLLKKHKDLIIDDFDFMAADIYSVGLIGLHLLGAYQSINIIEGDPQKIIEAIYSKNSYSLGALKINLEVCAVIKRAIKGCLEFRLDFRIDKEQLLGSLNTLFLVSSTQAMISSPASNHPKEFKELIQGFENYINYLHERRDNYVLIPCYTNAMKYNYLGKFIRYLDETYDRYLLTTYRTEFINVADGIAYFIRELYYDLNDTTLKGEFIAMIKKTVPVRCYEKLLEGLFSLDAILQDYALTGMCVQTYGTDWDYFFPKNLSIHYAKYVKLISIPELYQQFKGIILNSVVKEALLHFLPSDHQKFEETIDRLALERTYILKIQPSLNGLTTFNGNIFLSSYGKELSEISQELPAEFKAAILLTLLHELAHLLRRIDCRNFQDSKNIYNPKDNTGFKTHMEERKTENGLTNIRREYGAEIEVVLVGGNLEHINRKAAEYFLEGDFIDEGFKQKLMEKNKSVRNSVFLAKSKVDVFMGGRRCGVSKKMK